MQFQKVSSRPRRVASNIQDPESMRIIYNLLMMLHLQKMAKEGAVSGSVFPTRTDLEHVSDARACS
jgi:hypothetical protein